MLPFNDRLQVRAFAGPAFFNVKQDAVASPLTFQEVGPPFTSVTITGAPVVELEDTGTGATVGAEVDFMVTRHVGAGLMVRYSGATVELNLPASEDQLKLSVGGFQIGFGARVRF
jgi:hypothetical protein